MRTACISLALLTVAGLVGAQEAGGSQADSAIGALKAAYSDGTEAEQVAALEAATSVADPAVVRAVSAGVRSSSLAVRLAAIDALGRLDHPDALRELHATYRAVRKLKNDPELLAAVLKAIGRHGDPASIEILADSAISTLTYETGTARILGLGRIRDRRAADELMKATRKAGGQRRGRLGEGSEWRGVFQNQIRCAMAVLTGEDLGADTPAWQEWWRKNGAGLKVAEERPPVAPEVRQLWEAYWGESYSDDDTPPASLMPTRPLELDLHPDAAQVDAAVAALAEAYRSNDEDAQATAIEDWAGVVHPRVVREVARFLRVASPTVRIEAADALGWIPLDDALKQLHRAYRRDLKQLRDEEEVFATLLKAIGRHGDRSSIIVLVDSPAQGLTLATGTARIYGLARIRDRDAIDQLLKAVQKGGGESRVGAGAPRTRFLEPIRLALYVLTGRDLGTDPAQWGDWWRENRRTFEVSPERPDIPDGMKRIWEQYWNEPYQESQGS